jgi:peptidoglycan/LPS O-acetylase OafA/YrhL
MHGRSAALDAVRGLAITLVVAYHWLGLPLGWTGVDLFFVLSGYLIGGILLDHRDAPAYYATFYGRRAARILPLYALYLAIVLPLFGSTIPLWHYALFTQNIAWSRGGPLGVTSITWSLALEEQFYLLLPALVRAVPPAGLARLSVGCILAAPVCRILLVPLFGSPMAAHFLLPAKMDALFWGVLIACLRRRPAPPRHRVARIAAVGALSAAGLIALAACSPHDFGDQVLSWSAACSLTDLACASLLGCVLLSGWRADRLRALSVIGVGAYAIYLFHEPVRVVVQGLFFLHGLPLLPALAPAAALTALLAAVSWTRLESKLIAWARARWRYDTGRPTPPVTRDQRQPSEIT